MADPSLCTCGASLPLPDLAGLVTCPSCGRVTKLDLTDGPPDAADAPDPAGSDDATGDEAGGGSGSGWPAPPTPADGGWPPAPIAAPSPADPWAQPTPVPGGPTPPPFQPGDASSSGARTAKRIGCGCAPIAIICAIGLVVFGSLRSCDIADFKTPFQTDADKYSSMIVLSGSSTLVPGEDGATDAVAVVQDSGSGSTVRRLGRISFASDGPELLWQSDPLDEDTYRAEIAVVGDTMFAGTDDQLYALDAETGETKWHTTLQDKVTTGCASCFAAAGDRLLVRTSDAYVSAYGTESTEPLWSKRLNSPGGTMSVVGEKVLISDGAEASGQPTPIALIDPSNGRSRKVSTPTCPATDASPYALAPSPSDQVLPVPGTEDVMVVFGFGDGCVVRWDPTSGTVKWTSRLTGASSIDQDGIVVGDHDITFPTTSGALVTVDLSTGKARPLEIPQDSESRPERIVGRTLIGSSTTTRGTPKSSLVGWDLASGERLWSTPLPGHAQPVSESTYHSSDALFEDGARFLVVPTEAGASAFVFEGEQRTFSAIPVDLESGELGTEVRRGFLDQYDSGTPSLTIEGIDQGRLVISIDHLLQAIPVAGTGEIYAFPPQN